MLTKIFDRAVGLFDTRFQLTALFPLVAFLAACAWLVTVVDNPRVDELESAWGKWSGLQQVIVAILGVTVILVAAYLLFVSTTPRIRVLEGYFGPVAWVSELWDWMAGALPFRSPPQVFALDDHRQQPKLASERFPTKLGNALRAAELQPLDAYGLDAVRLWPMLVGVLEEDNKKPLEAARMTLDFFVVVCFGGLAFAGFAGTYVALAHGGQMLWVVTVAAGLFVAFMAYQGAVSAARDYGDQIAVAFALYRFTLLTALHLPLPDGVAEERRLWDEVNSLPAGELTEWWLYEHG